MDFSRSFFKVLCFSFAVVSAAPLSAAQSVMPSPGLSNWLQSRRADQKVDGLFATRHGLSLRLVRPLSWGLTSLPLETAGDWIADLIDGQLTSLSRSDIDTLVQSVAANFEFTEFIGDQRILPFFNRLEKFRAQIDFGDVKVHPIPLWTLRNAHVALLMVRAHREETAVEANLFVQNSIAHWLFKAIWRIQKEQPSRVSYPNDTELVALLQALVNKPELTEDSRRIWRRLNAELKSHLAISLDLPLDIRMAQSGLRWEFVGGVSSAATIALILMALHGNVDPQALRTTALYGLITSMFAGPFLGRMLFDFYVKPARLAQAKTKVEAFVAACERNLVSMDSWRIPKP